ncbi:hypothetical protein [Nocardia acidivorans]|uniref:hypothetical protein n=1 Tax=Nocardia acidivorans TaxID=404580 RepID=UPI001FE1318E|nr:hypothetical protein [Nocardia acidivorans]
MTGIAAAIGVILYFAGAVITTIRARSSKTTVFPGAVHGIRPSRLRPCNWRCERRFGGPTREGAGRVAGSNERASGGGLFAGLRGADADGRGGHDHYGDGGRGLVAAPAPAARGVRGARG